MGLFNFGKKSEIPKIESISPGENKNESSEITNKETERKPKTITEVDQANKDLYKLEDQRKELLSKSREEKKVARSVGVNEFEKDSKKRTQTFIELTKDTQDELVKISEEIGKIRDEFNLHPSREKMLKDRIERLEELKKIEEENFFKTESGKEVYDLQDQIKRIQDQIKQQFGETLKSEDLRNPMYERFQNEINAVKEKISKFYETKKDAKDYVVTLDKINYLIVNTYDTLTKSKQVGYDKNGINSI